DDENDLAARRLFPIVRREAAYRSPPDLLIRLRQLAGHCRRALGSASRRQLGQRRRGPSGRLVEHGSVTRRDDRRDRLAPLAPLAREKAVERESRRVEPPPATTSAAS